MIHALGLDLELSVEAQCLCAVHATAHYLATLNQIEVPRPHHALLAEAQRTAEFPAEFPIHEGRYQTARPPVCDEVILTE